MLPNGTNTYTGLLVTLATVVLPMFGILPTPAFGEQFPEFVMQILQIGGLAYAAYGRARAAIPGWFARRG